ncbi:hypothetical protein GNP80_13665 [Aliivibrio fischeri]|uniref:hypothetical protein n=1 Tax=Aliivibrio fischeri TaxID=668 RepID=UPI0012DAB0EE|nr:hypothetical protein [Aliivibrio fischeri]MUK93479.1 hypothetical protein [Aliivibrio fischeri]
MKHLLILLLSLLLSFNLQADTLIMCPKGRVNLGDSYENVKAKCGVYYGTSMGLRNIGNNKFEYKIARFRFNDGTEVAFIFISDQLLDLIIIK